MNRRGFLRAMGMGCLGCCTPASVLAATFLSPGKIGWRPFPIATGFRNVASLDGKTYDAGPLLLQYDSILQNRREMYADYFGEAHVDAILAEMRTSYADVIPNIPFEGRFNYHLQYLIPNAQDLAEYLVVTQHGMTLEEYAPIKFKNSCKGILSMPESMRYNIGESSFGFLSQLQMRFAAWISQQGLYEHESVCNYIPGDGLNFDWGMDYTRCNNIHLFEKYDAIEVVEKLICQYDYIPSAAFKMGYFRTQTLAEGKDKCDLRWKKGKIVPLYIL